MLGRQNFVVTDDTEELFTASLARNGIDADPKDFMQDDLYSETLMRKLGFGEMEALDFSAYEGAGIVHDLNRKPDKSLHNQFDMIVDGGTLEHIFNVPVALEGVYRMLKPGGRFISMTVFNGWPSHGMYQFTAELVWTFWRRACNCEVIDCRTVPASPARADEGQVPLLDAANFGRRLRKILRKIGPGRHYMYYEIEKTTKSHLPRLAFQSDYEAKWDGHENAGETHLEKMRT